MDERERILAVYAERRRRAGDSPRHFTFEDPAQVQRVHERYAATLRLLRACGLHPLGGLRILDVGCGDGTQLRQFVQWGAAPANLAGIDLRPDATGRAAQLGAGMDIRTGTAAELPWPGGTFNLVSAHTVFTSILDEAIRRAVAAEMVRVLRPGGAVLWYDFVYDNPRNPDVRGVSPAQVRALFPGLAARLTRITLAPPIARRIPAPLLPVLYPILAALPFLRTHCLGVLTVPR